MSTSDGEEPIKSEKYTQGVEDGSNCYKAIMVAILHYVIFKIIKFICPWIASALKLILVIILFEVVMYLVITLCAKGARLYLSMYKEFIGLLCDEIKQVGDMAVDAYFKYYNGVVVTMLEIIEKIKLVVIEKFDEMTTKSRLDASMIKKTKRKERKGVVKRNLDETTVEEIMKKVLKEEIFEKNKLEVEEIQKKFEELENYVKGEIDDMNMMEYDRRWKFEAKLESKYKEREREREHFQNILQGTNREGPQKTWI